MLVSVSIAVAVHVPTSIVIATFPVGTNPTTSIQGGGCVCIGDAGVNGGQTFTIVDIEGFTGTSISTAPGGAFQTQLLANTITIATNQWVAIVFMDTSSGAPHFIVDQCDNTCGGPPAPAGYAGLQLNFGTPNPSIGGTGTSAFGFGPIVGGTFQPLTQITPGSGSHNVTGIADHRRSHLRIRIRPRALISINQSRSYTCSNRILTA